LCDDGPEDFVTDGGKDLVFVALAEVVVDDVEFVNEGVEEDLDGDFDGLHVAVCSFPLDLAFPGLDVVDDGLFDDGDPKIVALFVAFWGEPGELVELDGEVSDIDYGRWAGTVV
jgi:hypothetical protein